MDKDILIKLVDSIRDYEHESGHSIYNDERESSEFVDIFIANKELSEMHNDNMYIVMIKDQSHQARYTEVYAINKTEALEKAIEKLMIRTCNIKDTFVNCINN